MSGRSFVAAILAVLVCAAVSIPAAAQGVGGIGGSVTDASGGVLPGVTVTLSNPGVIGGNQDAVTDARGAYQFTRLVPGTYSIRASLVGFRTVVQERIVVNADVTARVDLRLDIGALEESIVVSGQAPLLDTTRTLKQTVLTRELIETLPARSDIWAMARTVPSIIMNKYDVGGSEMFAQSAMTVHGSATGERSYLIDGMDVTWGGGEGAVISYFDAHMFEEVNYQTASGSAESAKGGVLANMVTRTGTNAFGGEFAFTGAGRSMAFENLPDRLFADLLAAVPARARAADPNLVPSAQMLGIYDSSLTLAGPIIRDRLWYAFVGSYVTLEQHRLGAYNLDGTRALDSNRMRNGSNKLSWQATRNSQLHFLYNLNEKSQFFRTENTGTGFIANEATSRQVITSNIYQAKWTSVLSPQMLMDVSASLLAGRERARAQSNVRPGDLATFDVILNEHGGAVPNYLTRPADRGNVLSSLSFTTTSHDLKLGYQFMWRKAGDTWRALASPYAPSGIRAVFRNGVPDSVNTYNTPTKFEYFSRDHAWYIQDRWTPTRKLTLNLGLRLETTYAWMESHCQEATIFIARQCFPEINGAPDFFAPAPRFGLIYDVAGDGRTAIKATINRYNQPVGVTFFYQINPVRLTSDTRSWVDANGDRVPQLNELGPSTGFNLGTTNRYSDDVKWPNSTELSVGVEQQLPGNVVASVTYVHRRRGNEIGARNLAVPIESYTPLEVTEVTSGRRVTVYNQDPALRGRFDILWDNYPEFDTEFNGLDLTFNKRMSQGWMLMGGVSFGKNVGDIYGSADLNNPNLMFRRGVIGTDVPVSLKLFGLYELPYQFKVSASAQHFTGFPELTTVAVGRNTVALTQVSQSITVEPRGTTRLPDVNMVDLSLRRSFRQGRYTVEPVLDVFNLLNGSAISGRTTVLGPTYGRASSIQRGRLIKLGVNVDF